jgi:predicted dehydrogenase
MSTLGVGVLGFGFMGRTHTLAHQALPYYYDPPPADCRLVAVCEATAERAAAAKRLGGFQRCTTDPHEVIGADDVDVIHVCTPNREHFGAIQAAIAAGKHLYVDKPVTASLAEADQVLALLKGYAGTAQVALQYRFFPATLKARQLVQAGAIGPVTHFHGWYFHSGSVDPAKAVNWKSTGAFGGGVIRDLGSHILDLLGWLIGPFSSACCVSRIWSPRRPSLDSPGKMIDIDVEDAAAALLRCSDGAMGVLEVSKIATGAEDELRLEIHGRWGALRFDLMQPNYLEFYDARQADGDLGGQRGWQRLATVQRYPKPGGAFPGPKFSLGWIRSHIHSLYSFLEAIVTGRPASPSLAEGIHLQKCLEALRESAATGAWVDLPQP